MQHNYEVEVKWVGDLGQGTSTYTGFSRDHIISAANKASISGSSDPAFRGDPSRYNPEELLVSALSACHMLWYLHLCQEAGVVVHEYEDNATGTMAEHEDGAGEFTEITLCPKVTISLGDEDIALKLHEKTHRMCFIARSVNFPIYCKPSIKTDSSRLVEK